MDNGIDTVRRAERGTTVIRQNNFWQMDYTKTNFSHK